MIDVELAITESDQADVSLEAGDLKPENGLATSVLISLFSDGRASVDEPLPEQGAGLRGWWAQRILEEEQLDAFGSLLWLLERSVLSDATLNAAEQHAREALEWLVADDVAERVGVTASRFDADTLLLEVQLERGAATAFAEAWEGQADAVLEVGQARVNLLLR